MDPFFKKPFHLLSTRLSFFKKHENEFNEEVALTEIYKYIIKYFDEILNKLERERGLEEAQKQLLHVKVLFEEKKKCKWM